MNPFKKLASFIKSLFWYWKWCCNQLTSVIAFGDYVLNYTRILYLNFYSTIWSKWSTDVVNNKSFNWRHLEEQWGRRTRMVSQWEGWHRGMRGEGCECPSWRNDLLHDVSELEMDLFLTCLFRKHILDIRRGFDFVTCIVLTG